MKDNCVGKSRFTCVAVPLLVLVLAVATRAIVHANPSLWVLANVSALPAIAFASGYLLKRWWAPFVVIGAMLAVDLWIDSAALLTYWPAIFGSYVLLLGFGLWGMRLPESTTNFGLLGRSGLACGVFYLVSNTLSWMTSAVYARSLAGWVQALTVGIPAYRPTWSFGLQMLASTLLFTAVILWLFRSHAVWWPRRIPETETTVPVVGEGR